MLILIDKLKRQPRQIVVDEQGADFPVLKDLIEHGDVAFNETINGTLQVTRVGDVVKVSGRLSASVTSPCGRCLTPVISQLDVPVMLCYVNDDDGKAAPLGEEDELQREELGLIQFSAPEIDLRPDLDQEIVMSLPQQPLCKETCKGLCPVCGNNLNQNSCDCESPNFHAGLAALKNIKINH